MIIKAKPEHEVVYQDLVKLVTKHADKISELEMLAIAANMLGKMIAMQDQRAITPAQVMEIVSQNIESGNKEILETLMQNKGGDGSNGKR